MVSEHLVGKGHHLVRCAIDFAQQPAFDYSSNSNHIDVCHQRNFIRGYAGLHRAHICADLLHGVVGDGVDVRLKKTLQMIPPDGF